MKKILLLGLALSAGAGFEAANAQNWGTQIGKTYYDLQTNASAGNRIIRHSDGTVSAVWIESCNAGAPGFSTRGTGYNYFDGTTWTGGIDGTCDETGADHGVNTVRTGWGEIVALPNNTEAVFAHAAGGATFGGITVTTRTKGQAGLTGWSSTTNIPFTGNITALNTLSSPTGTGTLTLTGTTPINGSWPRVVASGNYVHMIYAVNNSSTTDPATAPNGVISPFVYSRSPDGGVTWDMQNVMLPGLDTAVSRIFSVGGDQYALAVNGSTVAITTGRTGNSWALWKSTDNGSTWATNVFGNITAQDTLAVIGTGGVRNTVAYLSDGRHAVVVDNGGTVHAFTGAVLIQVRQNPTTNIWELNSDAAGSTSYYPLLSDGILYWNDGVLINNRNELIAERQDIFTSGPGNWIGLGQNHNPARPYPYGGAQTSLVSFPTAAYDASNNIYLVYSGVVEGTSNTLDSLGQSYRDLYVMKGEPLPATGQFAWSSPINIADVIVNVPGSPIAGTDFLEEVFPAVARTVGSDNILHITWQSDFEPGLHVNGDLDLENENSIMYYGLDLSTTPFTQAIVLSTKNKMALAKGVVAYPNPTTGKVTVALGELNAAKATIKVTNVMGQTVNVPVSKTENSFSLDLSSVSNGVYIYTITSDNATITSRIVKQ